MMATIERMIRAISRALMICSAASISIMALLVAYSTLMRYGFGDSLDITSELASFLLVACIFMALPYAAMEGQHIKLTLFTSKLSPNTMVFVELVTYVVAFLFFCLLTKLTFDFAYTGYLLNSHTETAYLYEAPWRAILPVVSFWMAVVLLFFCAERMILIKKMAQSGSQAVPEELS